MSEPTDEGPELTIDDLNREAVYNRFIDEGWADDMIPGETVTDDQLQAFLEHERREQRERDARDRNDMTRPDVWSEASPAPITDILKLKAIAAEHGVPLVDPGIRELVDEAGNRTGVVVRTFDPLAINLNAAVRVTLTDWGRQWYVEHYEGLGIVRDMPWPPPSEFTLWQLMHIFGPHVFNGAEESPFVDNEVIVVDPRTGESEPPDPREDMTDEEADRLLAEWEARAAELRKGGEVREFSTRVAGSREFPTTATVELVGRVNAEPFLDHPPGTVLLRGFDERAGGDELAMVGPFREYTFHFDRRERPWNETLHSDGAWRVARDRLGKLPYSYGDFSPLPTEVVDP